MPGEKGSYFRSYLKVTRTEELQERLIHAGQVNVGEKEPGRARLEMRAGLGQARLHQVAAASSSFSLQKGMSRRNT